MKRWPTFVSFAALTVLSNAFASQALAVTSSGNCAQFLFKPLPATIAGLSFAVAGGATLSPLLH
jgi:hypothetical protein